MKGSIGNMERKKVLIVNAGPLYPITGMYQIRVINQIKSLSDSHEVSLLFLHNSDHERLKTSDALKPFCKEIHPFKTLGQSIPYRIIKKFILKKLFPRIGYPLDYMTHSNCFSAKKIARKVNAGNFDVVITHYWQSAGFFRFLKKNTIKAIDTHYAVEENLDLFRQGKYAHIDNGKLGKQLHHELKLQNRFFELADLLIVNSHIQKKLIHKTFADLSILVVPNGQDLKKFLNYKKQYSQPTEKNILFYGSLSSQFNNKALRRIVDRILPEIRKEFPKTKFIALGANPPEWLRKISQNEDIEITGFVEDVRPYFEKSYLTLIPLESGAGFRGRTIELMAMGVPVIGTHNALDSIRMNHGEHGIIVDSDQEIITETLTLFRDEAKRNQLAQNARVFVQKNYSLDATFGKLATYLKNMGK